VGGPSDAAALTFGSSRLDSTRVEPMDFGCVELVDTLDRSSSTGATRKLSLLCNFYKVLITVIHLLFNVSYSLIYWFHICLIYFI